MPLVTTPGAASADSYASVIEADAYHLSRGNGQWTNAAAGKEEALRRATAWLDGWFRTRFPGARTNGRGQALEWPRRNAQDASGEAISDAEIPAEIIAATCEAALRELNAPGSLSPDVIEAESKVLTGVGKLSWTPTGRAGVDAKRPVLSAVEDALSGLIRPKSGTKFALRA